MLGIFPSDRCQLHTETHAVKQAVLGIGASQIVLKGRTHNNRNINTQKLSEQMTGQSAIIQALSGAMGGCILHWYDTHIQEGLQMNRKFEREV